MKGLFCNICNRSQQAWY